MALQGDAGHLSITLSSRLDELQDGKLMARVSGK